MTNLPGDLKYAKTHEWARTESDGHVRVGITDFAQEQLGDVVYVELPATGRQVRAGEACAVIESVKAASDVYSPASGEIVEVNQGLSEKPESINLDPYASWLFCVKPSDPSELESLLDAGAYQAVAQAAE